MPRKTRTRDEDVLAEAAAVAEPQEAPVEEAPEPPQREATLADRFVAINDLIVRERQRTRLNESTLIKSFETSLQYHAWQTQMDQQEAQRRAQFDPSVFGVGQGEGEEASEGEGLVEPDEYIGPAETEEPTNAE